MQIGCDFYDWRLYGKVAWGLEVGCRVQGAGKGCRVRKEELVLNNKLSDSPVIIDIFNVTIDFSTEDCVFIKKINKIRNLRIKSNQHF
jgi:hypothetical protein